MGIRYVFVAILFVFLMGCSYGKIRDSSVAHDKRFEFIEENLDHFVASYSGEQEKPGDIQFDLKTDEVLLDIKVWHEVTSKVHRPQLYEIQDNKGIRIGYLFSPEDRTPVRPDGSSYRLDPLDEVEIRNMVDPQDSPSKKRKSSN